MIKSKNIIMVDNSFYDSCNSFTVIEERIFYFICNEYRKLYNTICNNGGYSDLVLRNDESYNILSFLISYEKLSQELKSLKISKMDIITTVKMLPSQIIKITENQISRLFLFDSIVYDEESDHVKFNLTQHFFDVLKVKNFDDGDFFKIYIDEFKKISGKNTKKIYRLASKFLNQKFYKMNIKVFLKFFGLDKNCRMSHVDQLLKRCIKELETKTKFKVKFDKEKKGRTITHINFCFNRT